MPATTAYVRTRDTGSTKYIMWLSIYLHRRVLAVLTHFKTTKLLWLLPGAQAAEGFAQNLSQIFKDSLYERVTISSER